jgi:SAM-dependent methyltransferase
MGLFRNADYSHEHSLNTLILLYSYDTFLDNIKSVADMGCGAGRDTEWWATLQTRDEVPEDRNIVTYAVDRNIKQLEDHVRDMPNVVAIEGDFSDPVLPKKVDLIWSHDSFQYSISPFKTLASWNQQLNVNGMLVLAIPQDTYMKYNRITLRAHDQQYFSYNILNLMYMLAVSGFDCRDAYFYRTQDDAWLYAAVYKNSEPMDPTQTTWYDLAEKRVINDYMINSLNQYGYIRLEDLVVCWLDKNLYQITN